jgi:hypothetical protein
VIKALEHTGLLSEIDTFIVSSVGSILSMLLVLGYTPQEIHGIIVGLDFDKVLVLDCNEGQLPKHEIKDSFIPVDLQSALGLPGRHEHEAAYAYSFYRLLNRSSEIHFLFLLKVPRFVSNKNKVKTDTVWMVFDYKR